ncbi:MAG: hypothetical protein JSW73_03170 [Candidatus Woesearchaeota archaeon]|nr:MAG: hypothetical protein JSW73_03170 [Candidatus Woesearchaeota archaeon]
MAADKLSTEIHYLVGYGKNTRESFVKATSPTPKDFQKLDDIVKKIEKNISSIFTISEPFSDSPGNWRADIYPAKKCKVSGGGDDYTYDISIFFSNGGLYFDIQHYKVPDEEINKSNINLLEKRITKVIEQ